MARKKATPTATMPTAIPDEPARSHAPRWPAPASTIPGYDATRLDEGFTILARVESRKTNSAPE